ncbi:MAG: SpoIIIAH-like family protein [Ruminococcaceae bacterium]|nr:SpoIIIAH-like family protein [Oscillospiraceae bacterium]
MQMAKRNTVVAAVVLFVCLAVYLNWNYQDKGGTDAGKTLGDAALVAGESKDSLLSGMQEQGTQDGTASASGYFANARLNRQQARDSALSMLQEASAGADADQAMKEQTAAAIQTMADYTVTEAQIENLVVAKGYADCVAFIGEDTVSVVVEISGGQLTDVDTARITDIVTQATQFPASQIKIIDVGRK